MLLVERPGCIGACPSADVHRGVALGSRLLALSRIHSLDLLPMVSPRATTVLRTITTSMQRLSKYEVDKCTLAQW